ncbi:MAG: ABC transporter permease [Chitinophagaceae bacterium]|nr:ABC transporter permease [Oligoflexus sp.]
MIYLKLGFRNCWRQRGRNIFVLLSVIVGTAGMISLGGYINRWRLTLTYDSIYLKSKGSIAIYQKDGLRMSKYDPKKYTFTAAQQATINSVLDTDKEIETRGKFLYGSGLASNGCSSYPFEIAGYDAALDASFRDKPEVIQWAMNLAKFNSGERFANFKQNNVVGVSKGLARSLGKETTLSGAGPAAPTGDLNEYCKGAGAKARIAKDPNLQLISLRMDRQLGASDVDVAHIYSTGLSMTDDAKLTAPITLVQDLFGTDRVSFITAYYKDSTHAQDKAATVQKALHDKGVEADVYAWDDARSNPHFVGTMNFLYAIGFFFCVLILSVVVLSVINLTTMNVLERSREIGTLKAIGFRQNSISAIFLSESIIIALTGCLGGLTLSMIGNFIVNALKMHQILPGAAFPALVMIVPDLTISFAILSGMFLVVALSGFLTCHDLAKRSCLKLLS